MVNVLDAELLIAGTVIAVTPVTRRETGELLSHSLLVMTSNGIGKIKVVPEDKVTLPRQGEFVLWVIRNSAYEIEGNSGMSSRFVREVTELELTGYHAALVESSKTAKAAA